MRALIIDAEELFRLSLKEVISVSGPFTSIAEVDSESSFLATTAQIRNIDLVILYPASIGNDSNHYLMLTRRLYPNAAIISFSSSDSIQHSMQHGDVIILPRSSTVKKIVSTIRQALKLPQMEGANSPNPKTPDVGSLLKTNPSPVPMKTSAQMECLLKLSVRQRQILLMVADGLANKEIAARLDIAEGTVKAHMHAIFKHLNVTNRTQAVVLYANLAQPNTNANITSSPDLYEGRSYHSLA